MNRRNFIAGLFAAPAIVRASSLDGLALLRPTRLLAPSVLIADITVNGFQLYVGLSDGSTIGPLPMPEPIPYRGDVDLRALLSVENRTINSLMFHDPQAT